MRSVLLPTAVALLTALAAGQPAAGQSLTTVSVTVRIRAEAFASRFRADSAFVDSVAARHFSDFLNPKVGFLSFVPNVDSLPYHLTFTLHLQDTTTNGPFSEVGFWVRLTGPGGVDSTRYWLKVRDKDQASAGIGTARAFVTRLKADILPGANANLLALHDVLRKIPIASEGLVHDAPPGWALRFRPAQLCLLVNDLDENRFRIVSEVGGTIPLKMNFDASFAGSVFALVGAPSNEQQPFVGGMFIQPTLDSRAELETALRSGALRVTNVYLLTYHHDADVCRSREPGTE